MTGVSRAALIGVLIVAATATFGDFIWYTVGVRHTMTAGLIHGALLLTVVGAAIGAPSGRLVHGLPIGFVAGIGGALAYYALIVVMDSRTYGTAIPGAWIIMWLLLAALEGRWLRAPDRRTWGQVAIRGLVAAVLGGVAFALVRNVVWGRPAGADRSYLVQFLAWTFAWAPGLLTLTWGSGGETAASIAPDELWSRIERGEQLLILDVRTRGEYKAGRVPGAVNVPFNEVSRRLNEVPGAGATAQAGVSGETDELFVYCGHGPRASMAASALRASGRTRIVYITGHFAAWKRAGLRVERDRVE